MYWTMKYMLNLILYLGYLKRMFRYLSIDGGINFIQTYLRREKTVDL